MKDLERYQLMQMHRAAELRGGKKIKLRWNTPTEVRRSLAKVNNLVLNSELPAKSAERNLLLGKPDLACDRAGADEKGEGRQGCGHGRCYIRTGAYRSSGDGSLCGRRGRKRTWNYCVLL